MGCSHGKADQSQEVAVPAEKQSAKISDVLHERTVGRLKSHVVGWTSIWDEEEKPAANELQDVMAHKVSVSDLKMKLAEFTDGLNDAEKFAETLNVVVDILVAGIGGVIMAVIHKDFLKREDLQAYKLDGGALTDCLQKVGEDIHSKRKSFETMFIAATAHSETDRWEHQSVMDLVTEFSDAAKEVGSLEGQPKDGAIVLVHSGALFGAAMHLKYTPQKYQLKRTDNTRTGTRHAAALGFAEWFGEHENYARCGIAFARSDSGGAHVYIPRFGDPPLVLHFDTMAPFSQEEMLEHFRERIMKHGKLMMKVEPGLARRGVKGERVVTVVGGRVTLDKIIEDDTTMVIMGGENEFYTQPMDLFENRWEMPCMSLDIGGEWGELPLHYFFRNQCQRLLSRGFELYKPKPSNLRWVYLVTADDMAERLQTGTFISRWGSLMPAAAGDYLAMPHPEVNATEIYLMPPEAVDTLVEWSPETQTLLQILSQQDTIHLFVDKVRRFGVSMRSCSPAMIRPGKLGETVVTRVNGKITSKVRIFNDTSFVVRAYTASQELYVIRQDQFEKYYEPEAKDIDTNDPLCSLLQVQGFKMHQPKATWRRVYRLSDEDLALIPSRQFKSTTGVLLEVKPGDSLGMPMEVDGLSKKIFLMPPDEVSKYVAGSTPLDNALGIDEFIESPSGSPGVAGTDQLRTKEAGACCVQ